MKKFTKALAAIMLMVAVLIAVGCKKTEDPNNGGDQPKHPQKEYDFDSHFNVINDE